MSLLHTYYRKPGKKLKNTKQREKSKIASIYILVFLPFFLVQWMYLNNMVKEDLFDPEDFIL